MNNPATPYFLPIGAGLILVVALLIAAHQWDVGAWASPLLLASRIPGAWIGVPLFIVAVVGAFVWSGDVVTDASGDGGRASAVPVGVNASAGEQIFWGPGKCSTCHSVGGRGGKIRGPNLGPSGAPPADPAPIAVRAAQLAPVRAASLGHVMTATDYLVESIVSPGAYLAKGYKDEMPKVYAPPISLSPEQITSVILYLQSIGGTPDPSAIHLPPEIRQASRQAAPVAWKPYLPGDSARGRELFFGKGAACGTCHRVGAEGGTAGPDLTLVGATSSPELIISTVLEPEPVGGTRTPASPHRDYAKTLNLRDFHDLLAFLASLQPLKLNDSTADSARGRKLFFDSAGRAGCAKCHRAGGKGSELGPDLTPVGGVRTPQYILESILQPSKEIASGFPTIELVLRKGAPIHGLLLKESADSVWLWTPDAVRVGVASAAITERRKINVSTMPDNFGKRLSPKDLADLMAYLKTLH